MLRVSNNLKIPDYFDLYLIKQQKGNQYYYPPSF